MVGAGGIGAPSVAGATCPKSDANILRSPPLISTMHLPGVYASLVHKRDHSPLTIPAFPHSHFHYQSTPRLIRAFLFTARSPTPHAGGKVARECPPARRAEKATPLPAFWTGRGESGHCASQTGVVSAQRRPRERANATMRNSFSESGKLRCDKADRRGQID